jgi:hypothetical protein
MLERPFFTPVVVGFWCVTVGWLMLAKVLPAWRPGSPPGYQSHYATDNQLVPVAWTVFCNERPVGWAVTRTSPSPSQGLLVDSHLHFNEVPWQDMLPSWATLLVQRVIGEGEAATFDARGRMTIDAKGELRGFSSFVTLPGTNDPLILTGRVDEGQVSVRVSAGELNYETTRHLPTNLTLGDELSPQATIPGLTTGRHWTVPVYSPLRPGKAPIEILHAEVTGEETIYWEDGLVRANVVAYREDPTSDQEPRCRLWVDRTGRVLRQEAAMLGARVAFVRRSDDEAARLAASDDLGEQPPPAFQPRLSEPSRR